ncbi:MAG: DUF29 domain-containing protein [Deltaproteobacteria bacterium]|nr:DUF29 domain-containing protein [Deltaproteobacteria bacterium]
MDVRKKGAGLTRRSTTEPTELGDVYERDYYAWTCIQVHALREHQVSRLDWENLAEEVEDLGKAERHRLEGHLESLLMHLLKWDHQPQRRSRSWNSSIREHRYRIQRVLRDNPSLQAMLPQVFADAYEGARFSAEKETGMELSAFPKSCPWAIDDALRDDFWPSGPLKVNKPGRAKPPGANP